MASITDLYSAGGSLPFNYLQGANNETEALSDAGLQKSRLQKMYGDRALPGVVNRYASRGTFYSGSARVAADRLTEDTFNESADIDRMLARTRANLNQNLVYAAAGISV